MITPKDIEYIANLARIDLTDAQKIVFETELSAILSFVEKLNELNTDEVDPVNGGTFLENVMRQDSQEDVYMEKKSALLMEAAAETRGGFIKVKSVF
ncbi:MAG: Asp-tRNA(Asn)/Glu-tRNA(Gln) amidotransferase subunit GatC [Patescibacteria group bacterium]